MMKKTIIGVLVLFSFVVVAAAGQERDANCYTIIVGRNASVDGSVIVGHNEDDAGAIIVNLRKIKARDYGSPQRVGLGRGGVYETDGKILGFLWIEATTQEFADSFINERGVVVTSDSCPSKETKDDLTEGGIGYMLRKLVAEKASSARDAVKIASELIEKYGYIGSGRSYTFADKNEAWMMAVIKGRHWFAQRVPDDQVAVIPNHYTIRAVDPNDAANFVGSRDIVDYARKNGWYDEARDGRFDFKKAFFKGGGPDLVLDRNTLRHWRGLDLLSGKKWDLADSYPFSFKPAKKIAAESLMAVLRDHYEGTEYDATDGYKNGSPNKTKFRCICTATTINSFIVSLNAARPDPISVSLWIALGNPDTTVYMPLYDGVERLPSNAGLGPDVHDYPAFYERHFNDAEWKAQKDQLLHTKVLRLQKIAEGDYARMRDRIGREIGPVEKEFIQARAKIEADIAALAAKDVVEARRRVTAYVASAFAQVESLYDRILKEFPGR